MDVVSTVALSPTVSLADTAATSSGKATSFLISAANDKVLKRYNIGPVVKQAHIQLKDTTSNSMNDSSSISNNNSNSKNRSKSKSKTSSSRSASLSVLTSIDVLASNSIRAHDKDINCSAISPNAAMVATGSHDKTVKIWRSSDLSLMSALKGHRRGVWKVAFSPVDRSLASCSSDRTIRVWSLSSFTCIRTLEGHSASVLAVDYVCFGQQLISASADGVLKLWTIRSGECVNTMDQHEDKIWALAVAPPITTSSNSISNSSNSSGSKPKENKDKTETENVDTSDSDTPSYAFPELVITGGSDSKIHLWSDVTDLFRQQEIQTREEKVLKEQQIANDIRLKRYKEVSTSTISIISYTSHHILFILYYIMFVYTSPRCLHIKQIAI